MKVIGGTSGTEVTEVECPHCRGTGRLYVHEATAPVYRPCLHERRITDTGGTRCLDCGYLFPMEWSRD